MTPVRPGKRKTAQAAPTGMPIAVARATADRLTRRDRETISTRLSSRVRINATAVASAWEKSAVTETRHPLFLGSEFLI